MIKRIGWILMALFAIMVGLYPVIYFFVKRNFGLLGSKPKLLLANVFWNAGFYTHIILGGLALLIGWTQFSKPLRNKNILLHRTIGKMYVIAVLLSAVAGIGIGFFATGGWIACSGFICLGVVWFYTTLMAYGAIRNGEVEKHRRMMIYSYAACFAAVTLRIWLPVLAIAFGNFIFAYRIVAWLCWIPNLLVAFFINQRNNRKQDAAAKGRLENYAERIPLYQPHNQV